jgi:Clp amino terminal domain, pathogenicity island component
MLDRFTNRARQMMQLVFSSASLASRKDRFTNRARNVMQQAKEEAIRFHHEYIGTEHILLGLIREGSSVAADVLKNLDLDLQKVRAEVERIVHSGPDDVVFLGRMSQTPRVKQALRYAVEEAENRGQDYVGTEHLLLGLLREEETAATQILRNLGIPPDVVREELFDCGVVGGAIDPSWLSWNDGTVAKIARVIAAERRWEDLPILADALEEAGCTNREMLSHCRDSEPHVANCWVVNLLRGMMSTGSNP